MIGEHELREVESFVKARLAEDEAAAEACGDKQMTVMLESMRDVIELMLRALRGDPYVPIAAAGLLARQQGER